MQLAIAEAKRARDRGDYAIGAAITKTLALGASTGTARFLTTALGGGVVLSTRTGRGSTG